MTASRATRLDRICVTGPESTGKTTLAQRLAELLGTECVAEASRAYAQRIGRATYATSTSPARSPCA